jgi:hypothetical protein
MNFDQCLLGILITLGADALQAVCAFADQKATLLQNALNIATAFSGAFTGPLNEINEVVQTAERQLSFATAASPLLGQVLSASPGCGDISTVFGSAAGLAGSLVSAAADATYIARQLTNAEAALFILREETEQTIAALNAICTITALMAQQQAVQKFFSS